MALARAFTNDSPFVILDETSSALDPIAEYKMFGNMLDACANRTLIFISHRLSSATVANKIFVLENGALIETGSHAELMKKRGVYYELFTTQAKRYITPIDGVSAEEFMSEDEEISRFLDHKRNGGNDRSLPGQSLPDGNGPRGEGPSDPPGRPDGDGPRNGERPHSGDRRRRS